MDCISTGLSHTFTRAGARALLEVNSCYSAPMQISSRNSYRYGYAYEVTAYAEITLSISSGGEDAALMFQSVLLPRPLPIIFISR
jgi:hypothetical protein